MAATAPNGSDPTVAGTLGGPAWIPRRRSHAEELGDLWGDCGCCSEVGRLRAVLLAWPGDELLINGDPDRYLMLDRVDVPMIQRQATEIARSYASLGMDVQIFHPSRKPSPNLIFLRDLFFMTPEGAVVGRMASEQRSGEERFATEALAQAGIPVLATIHGLGPFEGADALWLDSRTVVLAVGRAARIAPGAAQVAGILRDLDVDTRIVALPAGTQHLRSASSNFLDVGLVAVDSAKRHAGLAWAFTRAWLPHTGAARRRRAQVAPGHELRGCRAV